jgi:hypothetical protein
MIKKEKSFYGKLPKSVSWGIVESIDLIKQRDHAEKMTSIIIDDITKMCKKYSILKDKAVCIAKQIKKTQHILDSYKDKKDDDFDVIWESHIMIGLRNDLVEILGDISLIQDNVEKKKKELNKLYMIPFY